MTTAIHQQMHQDHLVWRSENDLWRDDLRAWQNDLANANAACRKLQSSFEDHAQALNCHAAAIRLYEQQLLGHEHTMAEFESGKFDALLASTRTKHLRESANHTQQAQNHERIKRHHHDVVKHWRSLMKALESPM